MTVAGRNYWPLPVLALVAVAAWFYAPSPDVVWAVARDQLTLWQTHIAADPVPAAVAFVLAYAAATALCLPITTVLSLVGGALFGRWLGAGLNATGAVVGATTAFLVSRHLIRGFVRRRFGRQLDRLSAGVERDGVWYLLALRMSPAVPFFFINLGMGLTGMRTRTFALVSWLGTLPAAAVVANAGTAAAAIQSPRDVLSWDVVLSLSALGLLPLAALAVGRGRRPRTMPA